MSLQGKRILVIEDALLLALCVGQVLEEQGCEVREPLNYLHWELGGQGPDSA